MSEGALIPKLFSLFLVLLLAACPKPPALTESDCLNNLDDDADGLVDCEDPDCQALGFCVIEYENCYNGADDNGDGLVDCDDPQCSGEVSCRDPEDCTEGSGDEDRDGFKNCDDSDCFDHPECLEPEVCEGGLDEDRDGRIDCGDPDCWGKGACKEDCANGIDDNQDGLIDCQDPECLSSPDCLPREICANGLDDDRDGLADCGDLACRSEVVCRPWREWCFNGLDDDRDGLADCDDPDCSLSPLCLIDDCSPGADSDGDGLVGCADPDCLGRPPCVEDCDLPGDEDGDGAIDCADPDCLGHGACLVELCGNGEDDDGDGLIDCLDPDCAGREGCLGLCDNGLDDDLDGRADCADRSCASSPFCLAEDCSNGRDDDGDHLVDCEDLACRWRELCQVGGCGNGEDDDGDGLIDCRDPDCQGQAECQVELCRGGEDEDGDGLIDCDDPDCVDDPFCLPEICSNGLDDNRNGLMDCLDPACADAEECNRPMGEPCRLDGECGEGLCLSSRGAGFPDGGRCSGMCDIMGRDCPSGFECADVHLGGGLGLCLRGCEGGCEGGYGCFTLLPHVSVCFPDCTENSQCDDPELRCNASSGFCEGYRVEHALDGESCLTHRDCQSGRCLGGDLGWSGGTCVSFCVEGGAPCPPGVVCAGLGSEDGLGFCLMSCEPSCRAGYSCSSLLPGGPEVCLPSRPGHRDGDPCQRDGSCVGGLCLTEEDRGWPGGYCSAPCQEPDYPCEGGGVCSPDRLCLLPCSQTSQCRTGYACWSQGGAEGVCVPACVLDEQCPALRECNGWSGYCGPVWGGGTTGEPCQADGECESGVCLTEEGDGYPDGMCSTLCDPTWGLCPDRGVCLGEGMGLCHPSCQDGRCELGYRCLALEGAGGLACVPGCQGAGDCPLTRVCNETTGLCTQDLGLARVGDPCLDDGECEGGVCLTHDLTFPQGYCSSPCDPVSGFCPEDGLCWVQEQGFGLCLDGCTDPMDCHREGYGCWSFGELGGWVCVGGG